MSNIRLRRGRESEKYKFYGGTQAELCTISKTPEGQLYSPRETDGRAGSLCTMDGVDRRGLLRINQIYRKHICGACSLTPCARLQLHSDPRIYHWLDECLMHEPQASTRLDRQTGFLSVAVLHCFSTVHDPTSSNPAESGS